MTDKKDLLGKVLSDLKNTGGIEMAAIGSLDGLIIAVVDGSMDKPESFVAMTATTLGAAETAVKELINKSAKSVSIETETGQMIYAIRAGNLAYLAVLTDAEAGPGLVLHEMRKAITKIIQVLE